MNLRSAHPSSQISALQSANSPVVFFANGIGDTILALPALRALTALFPQRLTLVTRESNYVDLFKPLATYRQYYIASKSKKDWNYQEIERVTVLIGDCDLFIALIPWTSSSLASLIHRLRPQITLGFSPTYDIAINLDYTKHTAELNFEAIRAICPDYRLESFLQPPIYPDGSARTAETIKKYIGTDVRILAIHTETLPGKMWDNACFARLLDEFLSEHREFFAVCTDYRDSLSHLVAATTRPRLVACPTLGLYDALCMVNYSDLFLGIDSCMLHAADFGRVPSVGLFGPTDAREFGFLIGPNITIQATSGMREIPTSLAIAAMQSLLRDPQQRTIWYTQNG